MRSYRRFVYPACDGIRRCLPARAAPLTTSPGATGHPKGERMKSWIGCLSLVGMATGALAAADVGAGKAKAEAVCSACHGLNGVSVTDVIPNLAGQKAGYLEAQLKALKDGTRKN